MEFGVLGPLEVRVAGRPVQVRGAAAGPAGRAAAAPRQRCPLRSVGRRPVRRAAARGCRNALQTYAARLRQALGPAAAVVVTRLPGYLLEVPGDAVDVERFTALLAWARDADSLGAALALLEEALALWRGPAYAEFAETFARGEALRLQELRLAAREDRAAVLLRLGRLAEASAALEAIAAEEPWRERAVELLVTALAQAGRAGHALAAYARYRERLRDELGLDPSPRLRRLEQQVLRAELEPAVSRPAKRERRAPRPGRARSSGGNKSSPWSARPWPAGGWSPWSAPAGSARPAWPYRPRPSTGRSGGWTWPRSPTPTSSRRRSSMRSTWMSSRAARCWTHCVGGHGALLDCWSSTTASTCSPP